MSKQTPNKGEQEQTEQSAADKAEQARKAEQ